LGGSFENQNSRKMRLFGILAWISLLAISFTSISSHSDGSQDEEKFEFQAEVSRLMDSTSLLFFWYIVLDLILLQLTSTKKTIIVIINSLYANKDVFLRELLSNASDALDRIRYLGVKDEKELGEGENKELEIRISYDKDARTLTIRDRGVGMTKQDLIQNLGTVAKSGTTAFVEAMAGSQGDLSMIGQFGVGFYSVYLAADKVEVASKNNADEDQWIWTSKADSTFTIRKDPEGNTLGRGTAITLYLKEDADEYLDQDKLEQIIHKYSEFIAYPIYMRKSKQEQVDDEDAPEPKEGEEKKKKTVTTWSWERVNDQPAIWTRNKEDVTDEEYTKFYKAITKDYSDPVAWTHFKAEGEIEFKSILYVPKVAPIGMYDNYYSKSSSLKLYVRRVMITDEFEDLMPRYLSFVKGVVDSDDLPLNVSREQLQQHKILKVIGKKLVRKILEMLTQLSEDDVKERKKLREGAAEEKKEDKEETKFTTIWKNFAKSFKLGVIEDAANKLRLAKLLRFATTKYDISTLEEYIERMPSWQSSIFFLAGNDLEELKKSPFLERAAKKGVEVLLFAEPLDEYLVQNLPDFEGKKLQNLAKEGVKFGDESDEDKRREQFYKEEFQPLCTWMKTLYGDDVEKVVVSTRVVDTPSVIVTTQFGHSANMERIMKAQTMGDAERMKFMAAKKVMEINPRHPIVVQLSSRVGKGGSEEELAKDLAWLLFDVARLNSGFDIEKPQSFAERMYRLMKSGLNLDSLDLLPEADVPAPPPKEDDKAEQAAADLDETKSSDETKQEL
jgi:heat shock protein beta